MQRMSSGKSDLHLWIGLALLGWCSALTIHKQLTAIRNLSEVSELPFPSSSRVEPQTEDAIKISTLSQLLHSPNPEIHDASIKIIAERALQSSTVWRLLRQQLCNTTDPKARNQALSILVHFGPDSPYDDLMRRVESRIIEHDGFFHPATVTATVACLCNMLPAAREAEILGQHHDSAEADALWIAKKMLNHNVNFILRAGLVRKWLVNYPLNQRDPGRTKEDVIREMITNYEYVDDYERLLCCLLYDLIEDVKARQQMAEHGLVDPGYPFPALLKFRTGQHWGVRQQHQNPPDFERQPDGSEQDRGVGETQDIAAAMVDLSRTMRRNHDPATLDDAFIRAILREDVNQPRAELVEENAGLVRNDERILRRREETAEGRALRSRRREAMVFAEAGRPMRREDIIESRRANLGEGLDDGLEQIVNEVEGVMNVPVNEGTARWERTWAEFFIRLRPDGSIRE